MLKHVLKNKMQFNSFAHDHKLLLYFFHQLICFFKKGTYIHKKLQNTKKGPQHDHFSSKR